MSALISVVIPNYNDARIERTLKSIITQNCNNYQIVIVEGCLDNCETQAIYKDNSEKIDQLLHESDKGIFDALNKGIQLANGELILLLGSDDYIPSEDTFVRVINIYQKDRSIDGVSLSAKIVDDNGEVIRNWPSISVTSNKMRWGILPHHFSLFLNSDLYKSIGLFDVNNGVIASDTLWLLKLAKAKKVNIKTISGLYICMQHGGTSTGSVKNILRAIVKIMKHAKKMGYWNYIFIPFVKISQKIVQFRLKYLAILIYNKVCCLPRMLSRNE